MATANPLPDLPDPSPVFAPMRLEDFSPEAQEAIRAFEVERTAGTFVGITGEEVRARLEHGTSAEVQAYCAATFGPGDGPAAWLTPTELGAFFPLDTPS
jgi:hypothetical protein